ncbi:MAG TPA: N-acetyltransferase [Bauldia sp.]|jgi:predicted N-acetyltransferase YhbS
MIHFADERTADVAPREALLDRAMGRVRFLKPSEQLRRGRLPAAGLALVARERGKLVGSVRLWNIDAGGRNALLLGPLAVDPAAQGFGVGSGLVELALARAAGLGHAGIILVGDPEYYERFGFSAAPTGALMMPAPVARRRFLGLELATSALAGASGRIVATGTPIAAAERLAA